MKITKSQLKQIIKEELENLKENEPGHPAATEETASVMETANAALYAATEALYDISYAMDNEGFVPAKDASVTVADLDTKVGTINRYWNEVMAKVSSQ